MKKFILLLFIALLAYACGGPSYLMTRNFDKYYNIHQVDSVCKVDRIPSNLDKWSRMALTDDSTAFYQYMYRKVNDSTEVVWTLTDLDTIYRFKKRTLNIIDEK